MNPLIFFSASLISFMGLFLGGYIAFNVQEELKEGRKYFILASSASIALISFFMMQFSLVPIYYSIPVSVIVLLLMSYFRALNIWIYFVLGLALAWSANISLDAFAIIGALTFIYGLFQSGVESKYLLKKKKSFLGFILFLGGRTGYFLIGIIIGYLSWLY